jgi:hypothetical protein
MKKTGVSFFKDGNFVDALQLFETVWNEESVLSGFVFIGFQSFYSFYFQNCYLFFTCGFFQLGLTQLFFLYSYV